MDEGSTGALVPAVKPEPVSSSISAPSIPDCSLAELDTAAEVPSQLDKDFLCPICMQIIRDAFLTACGHSFCYMCIITHLRNKSDCPCCALHLTSDQLFPNFLLDKVCFLLFSYYLAFYILLVTIDGLILYNRLLNFHTYFRSWGNSEITCGNYREICLSKV